MTEEDAVVLREVGELPSFDFEPRDHLEIGTELGLIDMEAGARRLRLALRLPQGRPGPARAGPGPLRARPGPRRGPRAGRAAGPGPRRGAGRHRLPARRPRPDLRGPQGRALPRRHLGGVARRPARRRDPRRRAAAAALRGLLDLLPPRGRRRRPRHPRHLPRPPVRQGRDVLVRRALASRPPSTSGCWRSRSASSPSWRSPTASSTSPPATSAPRRRRSTTARPGSRARTATAS